MFLPGLGVVVLVVDVVVEVVVVAKLIRNILEMNFVLDSS